VKISSEWPRIIGLHSDKSGKIAAVWMAVDKITDRIFLYDTAIFERDVFAVIAERLKGKDDIPIAWEKSGEEVALKLKERKCKVLKDGYKETPALAEVIAVEIWGQMEAHKFLVGDHNKQWFEERERFWLTDEKVPLEGFPLMSATRHAMVNLKRAKAVSRKPRKIQYSNAGII